MCLSTAYRNTKTPEAIFMTNVIQDANLVEGFVLIQEEAQNV